MTTSILTEDEKKTARAARDARMDALRDAQLEADALSVSTFAERLAENREATVSATKAHLAQAEAMSGWLAAVDRNTAALERIAAAIEARGTTRKSPARERTT
jgi:hypothetical protein